MMKVTLTRKVPVQRFIALTRMDIWRERSDIQDVLKIMSIAKLPLRLQKFLQQEGLIKNDAITPKGAEVQQSGRFPSTEQGLCALWYVENDLLIGTRLVLFSRLDANGQTESSGKIKNVADSLNQEQAVQSYVLNKEKQDVCTIEKLEIQKGLAIPRSDSSLTLQWVWQEVSSDRQIQLEGIIYEIQSSDKKNSSQQKNTSCKIDLKWSSELDVEAIFSELLNTNNHWQWNKELKRAEIPVDEAEESVLTSFEINQHNLKENKTQYGLFSCSVKHLPVMPSDQNNAQEWYERLLKSEWKKSYVLQEQMRQKQENFVITPALKPFELEVRDKEYWLEKLSKDRTLFWHIAAPSDLNPLDFQDE